VSPRYRRVREQNLLPDRSGNAQSSRKEQPATPAWKERAYRKASWRLALKIAARTSTRALGRSALIVAMVALPVTGLVAVAVVADSMYSPSLQQRITTELGKTEAKILVSTPPGSGLKQDPLRADWFEAPRWNEGELSSPKDSLPAGTRIIGLTSTSVTATTATGIAQIPVREGESWDPSLSGTYDVTAGRTPRNDREVMVTASALPRLGAKVGDTIELRGAVNHNGDVVSSVTLVGLMKDHTQADSQEWIFARSGALSHNDPQQELQNTTYYLPDTPISWDTVKELNAEGLTALSRSVMLDPPPNDGSYPVNNQWSLISNIIGLIAIIAGFAAFEVILLAGAAFTVTARQQQRTLATIASVGAPRKLLFRILAANGIVLGVIGGLVGVAIGIGTAAIFMALTADGSATQYFGFHLPWLGFLAAVAFAVLIGWLASLVPARTTSRFDIVSALRGARKPPEATAKWPIVGLAFLLTGVALTLVGGVLLPILTEAGRGMPYGHPLMWVPIVMLIVGPILAQLALILIGPLILRGIARLLGGSGLGARLAARDSARNPGRAVPALAAVMTTVFVAVFGMCIAAGSDATTRDNWQWTMPLGSVRASLDAINYGDGTVAPTRTPYAHAAAVESAVRTSLDVDQMQRIASVPDPLPGPVETDASGGLPAPALDVPAQNLCPLDVRSPDSMSEQGAVDEPALLAAANDPRCNSWYFSGIEPGIDHIYVSDVSGLSLVLGREPSAAAQQALASGGAVSLYPGYVDDGTVSISWWSPQQASQLFSSNDPGTPLKTQSLTAVVDLPAHPVYFGIFISPATADHLGLDYHDSTLVASTKTMPTTPQQDALRQAFYALPDNNSQNGANIYPTLETGPPDLGTAVVWGLLGLAGLIALASSAIAIGLARFDGRQDDATLSALGAGRVVRRSFAFWQAIIIAGIGSVLGAATGLVPAYALGAVGMPFVPPWIPIGIAVVALPVVIACGSWLLATRSRVSARRVAIA